MIRLVDQCRLYPGRCAVLPQVGGAHPLGYLDSGQTTPAGERVYVSVLAATEMARLLGFAPAGGERLGERVIERLGGRIAELEQQVAERDEQLAAIGTLKLAAERKPAPKRKAAA